MKDSVFAELMSAATDTLEHARGKRDLRTTVLQTAPEPMKATDVKRLRKRLRASQAVFAHYLNVSTKLVQAWEAERRKPDGAALRLLRLAEQSPTLLLVDSSTKGTQAPTTHMHSVEPRVSGRSRMANSKHGALARNASGRDATSRS